MALPTGIGYCTVTGSFIRAILDGSDPGREPDGIPVPGLQITLKADVNKPSLRHAASKKTILLEPINVTTNANGDLIGADLVEGIQIIAGDDPLLGIFTWTATIQGTNFPRQTLTFDAPTGGTRDLSDLVEVPPAPGATLNAWLEAKNTTLAARDEVLGLLEAGGIGEPGPEGPPGPAGPKGNTGNTGAQGIQGVAGPAGPTGPAGATGAAGPAGTTTWGGISGKPTNLVLDTNLRLPLPLTQAQYDALTPPVAGQIYYIVSED